MRHRLAFLIGSEQASDLAVGVHVDAHGGGLLGQARHGHDIAADDHHETGTGSQTHFAHLHGEAGGGTGELCVVAEAVLGICELVFCLVVLFWY